MVNVLSRSVWSMYSVDQYGQCTQSISMVNVFGESTGEDGGLGNPRALKGGHNKWKVW